MTKIHDDVIFKEGEDVKYLYLIKKGQVALSKSITKNHQSEIIKKRKLQKQAVENQQKKDELKR